MKQVKKRNRQREVCYSNVERIKKVMCYTDEDLADLFRVSLSQIQRYKRTAMCAHRYYAARDALLVRAEEKAKKERDLIMSLFQSDTYI